MCANEMCSTVFTIPAPTRGRWNLPTFMKVIMAFTQAFQEALDMRRAAQNKYFLGGE